MNTQIFQTTQTAKRRNLFRQTLGLLGLVLIIASFGQILAACASSLPALSAKIGQEVILEPGQKVLLPDDNLELRFIKIVSDSRCPKGATCIWAGEVSSLVEIKYQNQEQSIVLTQSGGSDQGSSEFAGYKIAFSIQPYPELEKEIPAKDYRLKLTLSK